MQQELEAEVVAAQKEAERYGTLADGHMPERRDDVRGRLQGHAGAPAAAAQQLELTWQTLRRMARR